MTEAARTIRSSRRRFVDELSDHMQVMGHSEFGGLSLVSGVLRVTVDPRLSERALTVPVRITVCDPWIDVQPLIWVAGPVAWLRTGADWHVSPDRRVCFEFFGLWRKHLGRLAQFGDPHLVRRACQWLVRGTAHVLHVHYTCDKLGEDRWPEECAPTWPHDTLAHGLYEQEMKTNRHARKNSKC
jgi:hypothetical protein